MITGDDVAVLYTVVRDNGRWGIVLGSRRTRYSNGVVAHNRLSDQSLDDIRVQREVADSEVSPIFIQDVDRWTAFFDEFGVPCTIEDRLDSTANDATVSYVLFPTAGSITHEWVDGNTEIPLDETIEHMLEYRMNYEPALKLSAPRGSVEPVMKRSWHHPAARGSDETAGDHPVDSNPRSRGRPGSAGTH